MSVLYLQPSAAAAAQASAAAVAAGAAAAAVSLANPMPSLSGIIITLCGSCHVSSVHTHTAQGRRDLFFFHLVFDTRNSICSFARLQYIFCTIFCDIVTIAICGTTRFSGERLSVTEFPLLCYCNLCSIAISGTTRFSGVRLSVTEFPLLCYCNVCYYIILRFVFPCLLPVFSS